MQWFRVQLSLNVRRLRKSLDFSLYTDMRALRRISDHCLKIILMFAVFSVIFENSRKILKTIEDCWGRYEDVPVTNDSHFKFRPLTSTIHDAENGIPQNIQRLSNLWLYCSRHGEIRIHKWLLLNN